MNLDVSLAQLESAQLVRRLPEEELAYWFKHALTQEAAYESLLLKTRREIHRRVAEFIEQVYVDRLDDYAAVIAQHYSEAGNDAKTLEYAARAGDDAARRFANAEARTHYELALQALTRLTDDVPHRRLRVDTIVKRVSVSLRAEGPHRSLTGLLEAEALALELYGPAPPTRDDRLHLARIRYWMAQAYLHGNQPREAIRYLQEVLSVAHSEGDDELMAIPESMLGRAYAIQGRFNEAEPHLRQAVLMLDNVAMNHETVMAVGFLGLSLAARGNYVGGMAEGERSRAVAVEAGNLTGTALSGMTLCLIALTGGDILRLAEASRASIYAAEKAGDRLVAYIGHAFQAWAESRLGNHAAASEDLAKSRQIARQVGEHLVFADWLASASAEIALNAGRVAEALVLADEAVKSAQSIEGDYSQALAHRVWAQALTAVTPPRYGEAEIHAAESLRLFESGDARLEAARTRLAWGKISHQQGNVAGAREHFEHAAAQFEASGLERELKQARSLIDALSSAGS
jgi:tetratricopeptide (TPR) repeat protein